MHHEAKGLFATHLFDGEPLGQTDAAASVISEYASTPTTYAGGERAGGAIAAPPPPSAKGGSASTTGGKSGAFIGGGGAVLPTWSATPGTQSSTDWVPWAIGGGIAVVVLGGAALMMSGRSTTPNRRRFKPPRRFRGSHVYHVVIGGSAGGGRAPHSGTLGGPFRSKAAAEKVRGKLEREFNRDLAKFAPDERPGRARISKMRNRHARR